MSNSKVKMVSYTHPTEELLENNIQDVQDLVAFCARVSNPSNQYNSETSEKLLKYLIKHKHWSPFEMANVCMEITTTRDIARQILRHRSFSFQEYSQRYANPTIDLDFVIREARLQDTKNRQNSIEVDNDMLKRIWEGRQQELLEMAIKTYEWAIENGIAKEQARAVLPEGMTVSKVLMNGTVRSWIHYIELRTDPSTQKEHREVALSCMNELITVFPMWGNFQNITKQI